MNKLHIGKLIEKRWKESKMTKRAFAESVGIDERNVGQIFSKASIDTSRLQIISDILKYDFFQHYIIDKSNVEVQQPVQLQLLISIHKGMTKESLLNEIESRLKDLNVLS